MTQGKPMIDPKRELKGATPERFARALLKNRSGGSGSRGTSIVGNKGSAKKVPADKVGGKILHLFERS